MRWEYKIEPAVNIMGKWKHDSLDKAGEEEWEAINAFYDTKHGQTYILLKKPK